jgi:hypothetical protein
MSNGASIFVGSMVTRFTAEHCVRIARNILREKTQNQKQLKGEWVVMLNHALNYVDCVYELVKEDCGNLDSIYEGHIVLLVGMCGLGALKREGLLETCGVVNGRQVYVLVDKES